LQQIAYVLFRLCYGKTHDLHVKVCLCGMKTDVEST
jgi:hypothetical protein